ncbi:GntR family transcriptional regulator [Streptosporangium sp. OZ121]|uniref:GntR family transcriptional regulator n=1 Tax=Streptosporangium sp. OZ121 TaxID=3444183 RepID=UPI003F7A8B69
MYAWEGDLPPLRITSGEIPAGRRLPSQTELEQEFPISRNTIKKAFDVLKSEPPEYLY